MTLQTMGKKYKWIKGTAEEGFPNIKICKQSNSPWNNTTRTDENNSTTYELLYEL